MTRAYVSIGSNIEPARHVRHAVAALRERFDPLAISPVYETPAVGFDGDNFYNLVVGFDTELPPERLTEIFHAIEAEAGRRRGGKRFSARTLDIDLLTWGDTVRESPPPALPRGEILKYAFVLKPLADLAPAAVHPTAGRTYAELWHGFTGDGGLQRRDLALEG
ncbi:2-amino-4-hydroxy-6-hydroxymethyldihydropteridine diphosphokinase [Sediminicurvatus halobius]|uniref:2-amino-4-hydroxy-6-hydroxymethyldihydropteridine pyrophosphokinase n=1 Tax=Sediminicurvatus halobius TaxID=2182432 RepID=A0A2U2N755_9GAMM|nr:2-amino-4-hydroxy-6-hydroxymethyldihydropteridine diphosphokinase [Spiribacter halobius]PWG64922.1 2-amino-4-hydroxy-6-hydroxymethyldihydropteridine diphosphokinase [Spiribacter halobius]UEX78222.1 2-amino-4-hydroxy-6-hydroxymethyldihydropteridine diphosphokinase [Spiribacter halobius]